MKLAAFACAFLLALTAGATSAGATCQSCPDGYSFSHVQGICIPKSVSS